MQHTLFCLDCDSTRGLCSLCHTDHASCRVIQIRRYVYRDVVKVGDLEPHYDPAGIQSYTVNHAQAIFLSSKDKAPSAPYKRMDSTARCAKCDRGLRAGFEYCSLACKLAVTEGLPLPEIPDHVKTAPQRRRQPRAPAHASTADIQCDLALAWHPRCGGHFAVLIWTCSPRFPTVRRSIPCAARTIKYV